MQANHYEQHCSGVPAQGQVPQESNAQQHQLYGTQINADLEMNNADLEHEMMMQETLLKQPLSKDGLPRWLQAPLSKQTGDSTTLNVMTPTIIQESYDKQPSLETLLHQINH